MFAEAQVSDKKNYYGIDLGKFIMAFAVVALHTLPLIYVTNQRFLKFYNEAVNLAVPFFFLATGFLLGLKLKDASDKAGKIERVKGYLSKTVKMYILWSILYFPFAVWEYMQMKLPMYVNIRLYVRGLLFVGEHYNSWHLWYLLAAIYALLLVWLLVKKDVPAWGMIPVAMLLCVLSLLLDRLGQLQGGENHTRQVIYKIVSYTVGSGRILRGGILIPLGIFLAYKKLPKLANWLLFIGGFAADYFVEHPVFDLYFMILTAVGLFGIAADISLPDHPIYPALRNMSTVIYLIHMFVWTAYYRLRYGGKAFGKGNFLVTAVGSFIIAAAYVWFKKQRMKKNSEKQEKEEYPKAG